MKDFEIVLTEREVAEHYRLKPESLRNARCQGRGLLPWIKTPTGHIRYRLRDVIEYDRNNVYGFTFAEFAKLVEQLGFLDDRQKKELLRVMDARFRPEKPRSEK
jgi:hypothetical protein